MWLSCVNGTEELDTYGGCLVGCAGKMVGTEFNQSALSGEIYYSAVSGASFMPVQDISLAIVASPDGAGLGGGMASLRPIFGQYMCTANSLIVSRLSAVGTSCCPPLVR
jgi:hypothetical protein